MSSPGPIIGFVGLGRMGAPMSARLVAAGHSVVGYDVSEAARERLAAAGGRQVPGLGEVAESASLVILMLPTSDVVASVVEDVAFCDRLEAGAIVVDMSSSEPLRTRALAELLKKRGIRMLDAPVSGGVSGAQAGKLTIMVGGDGADVAEAAPYLAELGKAVHVGPVGSGHAVKALNNLLSATHLWATSEAMLIGERFGIDPGVMLSVFNSSSGRSGSTENKWPNFIVPGTFDSGFGLRLMLKDMNIAIQLAEQVGAPDALGTCARDLWDRASQDLPATADHTEVARWLADGVSESDH